LQYDSSKNHVNVTSEKDIDGLLKMERYDMASNIGFMPFNKLNTSKDSDENGHYALSGSKNYYFGMKLELPFVMPKGGKVTTFDGKDEDMIFSFSGDDDLWVFVDGNLVLDLGGVHDPVSGTINFATGEVVTKGNHYDEASGKYSQKVSLVKVINDNIRTLKVGRHMLQVYYLERGGHLSQCKIKFRLQEDRTPEETTPPTQEVQGPPTVPGVTTINPIPVDIGKVNQGVEVPKVTELEAPKNPALGEGSSDDSATPSVSEGTKLDGGITDEEIVASGSGTITQGGSSNNPEVEQ
jgi:fibro-slime domain-containing protein